MLETIEMNRLIICTAKPPATIEGVAVCPGKDIAVAVGFFLSEVNIRGATASNGDSRLTHRQLFVPLTRGHNLGYPPCSGRLASCNVAGVQHTLKC